MLRNSLDENVVPDFLCPITQEIMRDPVVAKDGHTYEREVIKKWFAMGNRTSPKTGEELNSLELIPNHTLKGVIESLKGKKMLTAEVEINNKEKEEQLKSRVRHKELYIEHQQQQILALQQENSGLKSLFFKERRHRNFKKTKEPKLVHPQNVQSMMWRKKDDGKGSTVKKEKEKEIQGERANADLFSFKTAYDYSQVPQLLIDSAKTNYYILGILSDGYLVALDRRFSHEIYLLNPETNHIVDTLKLESGFAICNMSPAIALGAHHLAIGNAQEISIFNRQHKRFEKTLTLSTGGVFVLLELPDGRLAAGDGGGKVSIWNVEREECEAILNHGSDAHSSVCSLALTANNRLASGGNSGIICIWDMENWMCEKALDQPHVQFSKLNPQSELSLPPRLWEIGGCVSSLLALPNGKLAAGYGDRKIRIWDIDQGVYTECLTEHVDWPRNLLLLPNGRFISAAKNKLHFWSDDRCEETIAANHNICKLKVLSTGKIMAAGDKGVSIWQFPELKLEETKELEKLLSHQV